MNYKKKSYSIALASTALILFLILVSTVASANNAQSVSPTITETQITNNRSASSPAIYGDRVVYQDSNNGNSDIYMYDLFTSDETQITTNGSVWGHPAINGDRIVWTDTRNGKDDIYMYDLFTSNKTQITTNGSAYNPATYGDRIVWENRSNENSDIYMYDLLTSKKTQITTSGSYELAYNPDIYGERVVWQNYLNGNWDIHMYDLLTKKETQITTSGSATGPAINADRIVWIGSSNGTTDIYMYDLLTKKETQITTSGLAYNPAISGGKIVYEDSRNGNSDIYMYDLFTMKETRITTSGSAYSPMIDGYRIVYQDYRNGNSDIYTGTISGKELKTPVANFDSNSTKGYVPLSVQFTDFSENAAQWNWDFGDGANSTEQNSTHIYSSAGTYIVNLTATNGKSTDSKLAPITVLDVIPVASFSGNVTEGSAPLSVQFTDLSENAAEWNWDFGDGDTSTEQNPTHIYNKTGQYTVILTAKNLFGTNEITKYSYINMAKEVPPLTSFSSNVTEGYAPLSVQFGDLSESAAEWNWDFGDGDTSTEQNPTHIYNETGQYTVTLTAKNMMGGNAITKYGYINVADVVPPVANFSSDITEGSSPLSVQFTDLSENSAEWDWDFGDGDTSTEQNPTHEYNETGKYTVTLTAKNMMGGNAITKYNYINVANVVPPVANFSSDITEGSSPFSVQFTDLSENAVQWDWEFGDGTNSTEQNPTHEYNETGQYTVTLTAKNTLGGNAITKYSYINVANA